MSLNNATQLLFKSAGKSIFDSLIASTGEFYKEPLNHDPVTGNPTNNTPHPVRMYGASVTDTEGLDQEVRIGDRIFYILVDELPVVPVEKGTITFEGQHYEIYSIETDAALAAYKCYSRVY